MILSLQKNQTERDFS